MRMIHGGSLMIPTICCGRRDRSF
uniref:Uncharacterized protein n=1 Tax=Musa acuminata subsp. malaccensis TaxID=214687 RepID=A0A804IIK1_MUSAM